MPGLLDAADLYAGKPKAGYFYDNERQVYVNIKTDREVTNEQVVRSVKKISAESAKRMKKATQQLIAGVIILSVWYSRMRDLMGALYKTIWLLAIGGFVFDDDTQRNLFYLFVLLQFNYLERFRFQVEMGMQALDGRAMGRAGSYGNYGNAMYQNYELIEAAEHGKTRARRNLGPNEEHCEDSADRPGCIELAALGWIPIEQMVPIGDATCYSNCQCTISYQ